MCCPFPAAIDWSGSQTHRVCCNAAISNAEDTDQRSAAWNSPPSGGFQLLCICLPAVWDSGIIYTVSSSCALWYEKSCYCSTICVARVIYNQVLYFYIFIISFISDYFPNLWYDIQRNILELLFAVVFYCYKKKRLGERSKYSNISSQSTTPKLVLRYILYRHCGWVHTCLPTRKVCPVCCLYASVRVCRRYIIRIWCIIMSHPQNSTKSIDRIQN